MCILLVVLSYVYPDARFRKRKATSALIRGIGTRRACVRTVVVLKTVRFISDLWVPVSWAVLWPTGGTVCVCVCVCMCVC